MADQIEVGKLTAYAALGTPADEISVSKLVMYAVMVPGEDDGDETAGNRQSFCYGQRIRRG